MSTSFVSRCKPRDQTVSVSESTGTVKLIPSSSTQRQWVTVFSWCSRFRVFVLYTPNTNYHDTPSSTPSLTVFSADLVQYRSTRVQSFRSYYPDMGVYPPYGISTPSCICPDPVVFTRPLLSPVLTLHTVVWSVLSYCPSEVPLPVVLTYSYFLFSVSPLLTCSTDRPTSLPFFSLRSYRTSEGLSWRPSDFHRYHLGALSLPPCSNPTFDAQDYPRTNDTP